MSEEFWQCKIKAFLHDPPDKALILFHKAHERKSTDIWRAIGLEEDANRLEQFINNKKGMKEAFPKIHNADMIASAMQRLNIPSEFRMDYRSKPHIGFRGCGNCIFWPEFRHTLSGSREIFEGVKKFVDDYGYEKALKEYGFSLDKGKIKEFLEKLSKSDWRKTYFLLWRFLPEIYNPSLSYFLPADTRIPDHSIWDHLDVTAAISSCLEDMGLFSLKIPAVQEFIAHSRKLSDLWASSHIFSTIIFEGIKVVADELGPDTIIYPQLRGNPMVDFYFEFIEKKKLKESLQIANFPNTFLCFIPTSKADEISKEVEKAIKDKWGEIADKAKKLLRDAGINIDEELWNRQIRSAIEVTSVWLEFFNFNKFNGVKDDVPSDIRKTHETWLNFTEDSRSYKNLRVERHGLRFYKVFDDNILKLGILDKKKEFIENCRKIFDPEKARILESLYEWLQKDPSHFYYITYEILGIILAQKSRFWDSWEEKLLTGKKCLMCGRRNAIFENCEKKGYRSWNGKGWEIVKINDVFRYLLKEDERLCAVCLTKRLYGWRSKSVFEKIFGNEFKPPKQESVVHVAARDFIEKAESDEYVKLVLKSDIELVYKQEWEEKKLAKTLSEEIKKKFEKLWETYGEPNKYYAILMMDGDRIGKMLSGETLSNFGEFLHPAFKNEILKWEKGKDLMNTKRIFTPSHHIAISRAMKDFSLYMVPKIVGKYSGFLVYAGGDDVLALFPADKVLDAAREIQEYFKMDFYEVDVNGRKRKIMGLGNKASMSAGIVFAHYKWPLYDAIEKVREAEKDAKSKYGRNAFCITFIKRSGEILTTGGKWNFVSDLTNIGKAIVNRKISHRFIYDFIEVSEVLKGDMLKAEVKRLLKRRREEANGEEIKEMQGRLCCLIEKYDAQGLKPKDLGNALKIIYDAYRGEAE